MFLRIKRALMSVQSAALTSTYISPLTGTSWTNSVFGAMLDVGTLLQLKLGSKQTPAPDGDLLQSHRKRADLPSTTTKQYLPTLKSVFLKTDILSLTHQRKKMLSLHDIYVYLTPSGLKDLFRLISQPSKYRQGITLNPSPPNASFIYNIIMRKVKESLTETEQLTHCEKPRFSLRALTLRPS